MEAYMTAQLNELVDNKRIAPEDNPVLQGNFAPVDEEQTLTELEVEGEIPAAVADTLLRNGSDGVLKKFDLDGATVALLEIDLPSVLAVVAPDDLRYSPFSRYPESVRDLALTVDQSVPAEQIREILIKHKLVKEARAQDVYTGEGVAEGKKSVAFGLVLQSNKGTLTSEQIDRVVEDLLRRLQRAVGAELRS